MAEVRRPCGCGCGGFLPPDAHGRRRYLDGHRDRAYRKRLRTAAEAAGLPGRLSLETVQVTNPLHKSSADAKKSRRRATRGPRPGVSAYFQPGGAEALLKATADLPDSPALARAREAVAAAIDRRKSRNAKRH